VPWTVTVRTRGRVERVSEPELGPALELLDARVRELERSAPRRAVDLRYREFGPGEQVHGRVELAGPERLLPRIRAGVDVRGDGSSEAYLGRLRRRALERRGSESPGTTLRRVLLSDA
jgi:hypothetical protein